LCRRQLGLGVYPSVSLEEARSKATQIRLASSEGDTMSERKRAQWLATASRRSTTFRAAFEGYFEMKEQHLSNEKHKAQWRSKMEAYVFPSIGNHSVAEITAAEVIDILNPIWNTRCETARRVLQRMRAVFEAAIVRGDRDKAPPTIGVPCSARVSSSAIIIALCLSPKYRRSSRDCVTWKAGHVARHLRDEVAKEECSKCKTEVGRGQLEIAPHCARQADIDAIDVGQHVGEDRERE
jgi:hypothetical protein